MLALAAGWLGAGGLGCWGLLLRRRLELVARAEHELRGPATVISLALERQGRDPAASGHAAALELEVERLRAGLADLGAARRGRRSSGPATVVELERLARSAVGVWASELAAGGRETLVDWEPTGAAIRAAPGRVAQALGNVVANAVEHGEGPVTVRGRQSGDGVRVEVRNRADTRSRPSPGRGRGLAIAAKAAADAGGRLRFERLGGTAVATIDLPAGSRDQV